MVPSFLYLVSKLKLAFSVLPEGINQPPPVANPPVGS